MNYHKIYDQIILKAKEELRSKNGEIYYESHHILPRSLGGNNKKENLVLLTAREHFLCHLLLVKIHKDDPENYLKMLRAFIMMSTSKNKKQSERYTNSRIYESIKIKLYGPNGALSGSNGTFYGKTHDLETRERFRQNKIGDKNPMYGKTPWNKGKTKETDQRIREYSEKQKQSDYHKNRPDISEETRTKLSVAAKNNNLGKVKTDEHKNSISKHMKEFMSTDEGKERHRIMTMKSSAVTKGVKKEIVKCPYCNKEGGKPAMTKHHFDNCKEKP